jgi:sugar fermentation stimulation protein A
VRFEGALHPGRLIRRYKRFLADVELDSGETVTAHTANPGAMTGLIEPGRRVYLSHHDVPSRKLKYSWQLVKIGRSLVGVNPALANDLAAEGIERGVVTELQGYAELKREVRFSYAGEEKPSRLDLRLEGHASRPDAFVEVKNVSLVEGEVARFPDAKTERGRKHLRALEAVVAGGERGVLLYVVQRPEPKVVSPAEAIDPLYADALREAAAAGVEVLAYRAKVGTRELKLTERLPVRL